MKDRCVPRVSVVMPVFNAEQYIGDTLRYLAYQDFSDFEVVVVDDGSTDSTNNIIQEFSNSDRRFIHVRQENSGAANARNNGFRFANGDWIIFLDADDVFEVTLLSRMYAAAKESNADIIVCDSDAFSEDPARPVKRNTGHSGLTAGIYLHEDLAPKMFQVFKGCPWNKLISKSLIERNSLEFQDLHHSNDAFFIYMALSLAKRVAVIDDVLVHYRQSSGNSLRRGPIKQPLCDCYSFDAIRTSLKDFGLLEKNLCQSLDNLCVTLFANTIISYASRSSAAGKELHEAFFKRYAPKWGIDSVSYPYIRSRERLWVYKQLQKLSYPSVEWVCNGSRLGQMTMLAKTVLLIRLAVAGLNIKK